MGICLVCARFPLRRMTMRKQRGGGGESYHKWGGPKPFLGRGFMVLFSPPLSFPPPLCFSLIDTVPLLGHCERSEDCETPG